MMKIKKKKNRIAKARRRCHKTLFFLGAAVGGAVGFNLRKLLDAAVERVAAKK